ncbi:MAG: hydrogenase maturation nickel metallochaperone HypA [Chromatiales bacterium]|nr:hydrogenase maturation nickel metallochaperone HypA [Chromatiales bacterium]
MHESGLVEALLRRAIARAEENGARRIVSISLRIGALCPITPEHLAGHFRDACAGTLAADAELRITTAGELLDQDAMGVILEELELQL